MMLVINEQLYLTIYNQYVTDIPKDYNLSESIS